LGEYECFDQEFVLQENAVGRSWRQKRKEQLENGANCTLASTKAIFPFRRLQELQLQLAYTYLALLFTSDIVFIGLEHNGQYLLIANNHVAILGLNNHDCNMRLIHQCSLDTIDCTISMSS
jgi:hypothetical protein